MRLNSPSNRLKKDAYFQQIVDEKLLKEQRFSPPCGCFVWRVPYLCTQKLSVDYGLFLFLEKWEIGDYLKCKVSQSIINDNMGLSQLAVSFIHSFITSLIDSFIYSAMHFVNDSFTHP